MRISAHTPAEIDPRNECRAAVSDWIGREYETWRAMSGRAGT